MRFKQRPDDNSATVSTGLREEWPVEDGEFEIPEEYLGEPMATRLINAGHEPLEPEALPEGATYEDESGSDEESESGVSRLPADSTANASEFASDGDEEPAAAEEEPDTEEEVPEIDLGERDADGLLDEIEGMDRSELYSLANEEFDLGWSWSGDGSLNTEEMRDELGSHIEEVR